MSLVLATEVLTAVLRGSPGVLTPLRALHDPPWTSATAAERVLAAARPAELVAAEDLLAWVRVVPVDLAVARRAAELRRFRVDLDAETALSAACAAGLGVPLVVLGNAPDLDGVEVRVWRG